MASLSTKTFRALNNVSGLNIVTVKAVNAIDAINKVTPLLDQGGVAYDVNMMLNDMMNADDPYSVSVEGIVQNMVSGYGKYSDIKYIFCANAGRFLTVLSDSVLEDFAIPSAHDAKFLRELGATS